MPSRSLLSTGIYLKKNNQKVLAGRRWARNAVVQDIQHLLCTCFLFNPLPMISSCQLACAATKSYFQMLYFHPIPSKGGGI